MVTEKWMKQRRNELLYNSTEAEANVYRILQSLGYRAIRQFPINTGRKIYFADIYLPELKTIIELDGKYHDTATQKRLDRNRSAGIYRLGLHVLRINNRDSLSIEKILKKLKLLKK